MGIFDTFLVRCPKCNERFESQTKLTDCLLGMFQVGEHIQLEDCRLEMKTGCPRCGLHPVAVIEHGMLKGYEEGDPTLREGPWGTTIAIGADRETEVVETNRAFVEACKKMISTEQ